ENLKHGTDDSSPGLRQIERSPSREGRPRRTHCRSRRHGQNSARRNELDSGRTASAPDSKQKSTSWVMQDGQNLHLIRWTMEARASESSIEANWRSEVPAQLTFACLESGHGARTSGDWVVSDGKCFCYDWDYPRIPSILRQQAVHRLSEKVWNKISTRPICL